MPGGRGEDERNMFAEELIAMRNQRGKTQEETATKMLVSASMIANIESGTGEAAGRGVCADQDELRELLSYGNWSNGSAFAIESTRKRTSA